MDGTELTAPAVQVPQVSAPVSKLGGLLKKAAKKAIITSSLFLAYKAPPSAVVIPERIPTPKAPTPKPLTPIRVPTPYTEFGLVMAQSYLEKISKLLKPTKAMLHRKNVLENLKDSCAKFQEMYLKESKENSAIKKVCIELEKELRRQNGQCFVLRKKFLKVLNGFDGLPLTIEPTEEELQELRNKVIEATKEVENLEDRMRTKREKLYEEFTAPLPVKRKTIVPLETKVDVATVERKLDVPSTSSKELKDNIVPQEIPIPPVVTNGIPFNDEDSLPVSPLSKSMTSIVDNVEVEVIPPHATNTLVDVYSSRTLVSLLFEIYMLPNYMFLLI